MARSRAITDEDVEKVKAIWRMFAPPLHVPREPVRPSSEPVNPYANALYRWLKAKERAPGPSPDISRYMAGDT